jgi:hypothetical protein
LQEPQEIKELKAKISELEKKKADLNLLLTPEDSLYPAV